MAIRHYLFILLSSLSLAGSVSAQIVLSDVAGWTPVKYTTRTDYVEDQQTGQRESDMVGQPGYEALYKAYDDGGTPNSLGDDTIGFRIRVAEGVSAFDKYAFIGIDADGVVDGNGNRSVDVFVGGNQSAINFYSTGTGLNVSPNTTTVANLVGAQFNGIGTTAFAGVTTVDSSLNLVDPAPYSNNGSDPLPSSDPFWTADISSSTTGNLDGELDNKGNQIEDYFFSFSVSMAALIDAVEAATALNPNKVAFRPDLSSPLTFMALTSTQDNSYNQDLNGHDGDLEAFANSTMTWEDLGANSSTYTADGVAPVPEPAFLTFFLGLFSCWTLTSRRLNRD